MTTDLNVKCQMSDVKCQMSDMYDVICIGSAGQDIFFPLGDVPIYNTPEDLIAQKHLLLELGAKYRVPNRYESPGGGAMNASVGLSRLGIRCAPLVALGDDAFSSAIQSKLKQEKVPREMLQYEKNAKTDVSCVLVDTKSADRTIVYNRDTSGFLRLHASALRKGRALFVSGLYGRWKQNMDVLAEATQKTKKRLFYNPSQRNITDHPLKVLKILQRTEGLFVNKDEATELVLRALPRLRRKNDRDEIYLAKTLQKAGPKFVVLTDGAHGAWVYDGDQALWARPQKVTHAIDSTGAGDAFTSAFLAGYLRGGDMIMCLKQGIANGRSVVQYYGSLEGLLTKKEIVKLVSGVEVKVLKK